MRLSQSTVKVLKNFAAINNSIWIEKGKKITTVSPAEGSLVATAELEDEFPLSFGILEIPRFLAALSGFDPEKYQLKFTENNVVVTEGPKKLVYNYCIRKVIHHLPPEGQEIEFPTPILKFDIPVKAWTEAVKFLHVLGMDALAIVGEKGAVKIKILTPKNPTTDVFSNVVAATDKEFVLIYKGDYIGKLLEGDYSVSVANGLTHFQTGNVSYFVPPDSNSKYPE
jgi:hypothetical protein